METIRTDYRPTKRDIAEKPWLGEHGHRLFRCISCGQVATFYTWVRREGKESDMPLCKRWTESEIKTRFGPKYIGWKLSGKY